MGVGREEVLKVARLARLELSDDEVDSLVRELDEILGHVEALERRGSKVEHRPSIDPRPSTVDLPVSDPLPGGEAAAGGDRLSGALESLAPDFRDGFFRVPRLESHEDADEGRE